MEEDRKLDVTGKINYWNKKAQAGDAKAEYCLGIAIRPSSVWIGPRDEKRSAKNAQIAITWIRRSAEQGFAPAQEDLANAYLRGKVEIDGVNKDLNKFKYWIEKAANQGIPSANILLAQWYLGIYHNNETETFVIHRQKAYRYFRLAIELLKIQYDPTKFQMFMTFTGLEQQTKDLAQKLTANDRSKANLWVKSQLQKFKKP